MLARIVRNVLFVSILLAIWFNCTANVTIETNQFQNQVPNYIISTKDSQIYVTDGITGKVIHNNTNATKAIQDTLSDLRVGGKIFFRDGTYVITSTILVPSNVIIEGQSWNTVIKLANLANADVFKTKSSGMTNITIRNLQIDGNREGQTLLYPDHNLIGIEIPQATNSTFENLFIKNTAGFGISVVTNLDHPQSKLIVRNVSVNNTGGDGIFFRSESGLVDNVRVNNYGDTGIVMSRCQGCVLSNSIVIGDIENNNASDGINVSRTSQGVSIIGNIVKDASRDGIHFASLSPDKFAGHDILIDGNLILNSKENGILLQSDEKNIVISNNLILDNGRLGIISSGDGININHNVIGQNMQHGISVFNSLHTGITDNLIYNNGRQKPNTFDGINIGGYLTNNIDISNNYIFDNQYPATQRNGITNYNGSNIRVEGNTVENNLNNQIGVPKDENTSTKQFLTLNGNKFVKPDGGGITEIRISGYIENYKSGTNMHLTIIKPDKTTDNELIFATKAGYFDTVIDLTHYSQTGEYQVVAKYFDSVIGSAFFTVTDKFSINEQVIPKWVKNSAKWWSSGYISNSEFLLGIDYALKGKIMITQETVESGSATAQTIPSWIKNTASWWSNDLISTKEFIDGMEYLYNVGIIQ